MGRLQFTNEPLLARALQLDGRWTVDALALLRHVGHWARVTPKGVTYEL